MATKTKTVDKAIEQAYYRNCSGIEINILDIPKVFAEGRRALLNGEDLDAAIVTYVNSIRKN